MSDQLEKVCVYEYSLRLFAKARDPKFGHDHKELHKINQEISELTQSIKEGCKFVYVSNNNSPQETQAPAGAK